jgi:DNA polymerase III sliding clamp (beta) subunit (PCNA family)
MFYIKTNKKQLTKAINFVASAVPAKPDAPIFGTIYLELIKDKLYFRATNGETDRIYLMPVLEGTADEAVCVDPILGSIVNSFDEDTEIYLEQVGSQVQVKQLKKEHLINSIPGKEYPTGRPSVGTYEPISHQLFFSALKKAAIAVSEVTHDPVQTCYSIGTVDETIMATDGFQIVVVSDIPLPAGEALPPAKLMAGLASITQPDPEQEFSISLGTNIGLRTDTWEIRIKGISGEFPNAAGAIVNVGNLESVLEFEIEKRKLLEVLEVCRIYAGRASSLGFQDHTTLKKTATGLTLAMKVPGVASFEEPVEVKQYLVEPDEFTILFNSGRTIEAIREMSSEVLIMKFSGSGNPFFVYETIDTGNGLVVNPSYTYLEVPMKA